MYVNGQQILEADKDPSKYPNLVVRVTGFTAYFCSLTPEFRNWWWTYSHTGMNK